MIHLRTNILRAMNAIDDGTIDPIVEYGDYVYLLNTSNRRLGVIIYTKFLRSTGGAIATYHTVYASYHTVLQVIANPLPRIELPPLVELLPGYTPNWLPDPLIIPSSY